MKTIVFFCALTEKGCAFMSAADTDLELGFEHVLDDTTDTTGTLMDDLHNSARSRRHGKGRRCHGQLMFRHDEFNQPYIEYVNKSAVH